MLNIPMKVYLRVVNNRQGELYSMFFGEHPYLESGEEEVYLGEIETEEEYNRISFLNGRASVKQLKLEFIK